MYFLLSVWTERRNKKEPRTRSAVEQMGLPVSGCGTRGFAAQTVLARDDTEKPHLLPTAPLSFAQQTPRHLSWQTSEAVFIMISFFRIGLDLNIQNTRSIKNENRLTLVDTLDSRHSILFDYRVWSEAEILEFIIRFKIDGVFDGFQIDVN